jgi:hypothetical protein
MSSRPNSSQRIHRLMIPSIFSALLASACCPVVTSFALRSGAEGTEGNARQAPQLSAHLPGHNFARKRYDRKYRWEPSPEIEAAIWKEIFGRFETDKS